MSGRGSATAFAPGSVANVAVGFDLVGHSVSVVGDAVTARRASGSSVRITSISGSVTDLPFDPERNTAAVAVRALAARAQIAFGIDLEIQKGVPLESGLGGSAASAVAAVVAANALLAAPFDQLTLLKCALAGEETASGSRHFDNIAPALYGGLVLVVGLEDPHVRQVPVPGAIRSVLVRPHIQVPTRMARAILSESIRFADHKRQQANLAGFLAGCYTGDLELIRASLHDVVIEPQRKGLIPGFGAVQQAALAEGALGCSIAGAGPTVFAWCDEARSLAIQAAMVAEFRRCGVDSDSWISGIDCPGARLLENAAATFQDL